MKIRGEDKMRLGLSVDHAQHVTRPTKESLHLSPATDWGLGNGRQSYWYIMGVLSGRRAQ